MEENNSAVELLILFYINTKHVLKTKQMDERAFLELMIKYCRENGFDNYSDGEICDTWKSLITNFLKLKNNGTKEEKEIWKYYNLLDSCYNLSDFHNGVYPKFSDDMVWFLIECFLKRKRLENTEKKNSITNEVYKDFQRKGYLYITKQDIENKWKYLNVKYCKLKNDVVAFNKIPYLQALSGYHSKDDNPLVKMIFTEELTEILIERFTKKKVRCIIHGYDSDEVLSEIQLEFRDLGYDFTQEEIKKEWRKLVNIYSFLKSKGRQESSWIYYKAMNEHFKNDYLYRISESQQKGVTVKRTRQTMRNRSKSVGAEAKIKQNNTDLKTNLIVNIEQLSPSSKKGISKNLPFNKKKMVKKRHDVLCKKSKMPKIKLKSKEDEKISEDTDVTVDETNKKCKNNTNTKNSLSVKRNIRLSKLSIEKNDYRGKRRRSDEITSPNSKVHVINIKESEINKNNGNLTINLPSITKQFSDNEFLPLKKRLRLGVNQNDQLNGTNEIKDGFLGFPSSETETHELIKDTSESQRLSEEEMAAIMERVNTETTVMECVSAKKCVNSDFKQEQENLHIDDSNFYKQDTYSFNYDDNYNVNQNQLLVPKEECHENLPVQSYNTHTTTPPPVLLVVIKVDGNKNSKQDGSTAEVKNETENKKDKPINSYSDQLHSETITKEKLIFSNSNDTSYKNNTSDLSIETVPEKDLEVSNVQMDESDLLNSDINVYEELISTENNNSINSCNGPVFVGEKNTISTINTNKSIKVPVKSGGELKEISISPKEFNKLAKASRNVRSFVPPKNNTESNKMVTKTNPKIKFISQIIKPAKPENIIDNKLENNPQNAQTNSKFKQISNYTASNSMPPPNSSVPAKKMWSSNCSSHVTSKSEEFENESIFSEATVDDDVLKDNLLATVIDFQEQNNQEFVEIKNLMKQNNLLQRETNRLLRLMLEKM